jgi:hypothetical protein
MALSRVPKAPSFGPRTGPYQHKQLIWLLLCRQAFWRPTEKKMAAAIFGRGPFQRGPRRPLTTWGRAEVGDKLASVDTNDMIRSLLRQVAGSPLIAFEDDRCTCNLRASVRGLREDGRGCSLAARAVFVDRRLKGPVTIRPSEITIRILCGAFAVL